jgi:hypothetical protein
MLHCRYCFWHSAESKVGVYGIRKGEIPYECRPLQQVFPLLFRIEVPRRRRRHRLTQLSGALPRPVIHVGSPETFSSQPPSKEARPWKKSSSDYVSVPSGRSRGPTCGRGLRTLANEASTAIRQPASSKAGIPRPWDRSQLCMRSSSV